MLGLSLYAAYGRRKVRGERHDRALISRRLGRLTAVERNVHEPHPDDVLSAWFERLVPPPESRPPVAQVNVALPLPADATASSSTESTLERAVAPTAVEAISGQAAVEPHGSAVVAVEPSVEALSPGTELVRQIIELHARGERLARRQARYQRVVEARAEQLDVVAEGLAAVSSRLTASAELIAVLHRNVEDLRDVVARTAHQSP